MLFGALRHIVTIAGGGDIMAEAIKIEQANGKLAQALFPSFAPSFLDDHARKIISDPKTALVELVANCWDAGADRVNITWPETPVPKPFIIEDNGTGMTYKQFSQRWLQFNYNRREAQGEYVEFPPDNQESRRKAFGRNGKGRHSVFCFAEHYNVETWRDGESSTFIVTRNKSNTMAKPYEVVPSRKFSKKGHGTIITAELGRGYLEVSEVRELIGSKFVVDPTFMVYVNGELVELTDFEHLIETEEVSV